MFQVPEQYRITSGRMKSDSTFQNNGCFILPSMIAGRSLICIASDGLGEEIIYEAMIRIEQRFLDEEDEDDEE